MFKGLLLSLLLAASPALAQDTPKPTTGSLTTKCFSTQLVAEQMKKEDQRLIFFGKAGDGVTMLYRNTEKTDWYIVTVSSEHPEMSCFVLDGLISDTNVPTGIPFKSERQALEN